MNTLSRQQQFKALTVLNIAMVAGVVFFSLVALAVYFSMAQFVTDKLMTSTVLAIVMIVALVLIMAARIVYSHTMIRIKDSLQYNSEKLQRVRSLTILHLALCEIPALLALGCFIIFGNFLFFIVVGIAVLEMISKYPVRQKFDEIATSGYF